MCRYFSSLSPFRQASFHSSFSLILLFIDRIEDSFRERKWKNGIIRSDFTRPTVLVDDIKNNNGNNNSKTDPVVEPIPIGEIKDGRFDGFRITSRR